jgi:hypothetical protein
LLNKLLLFWFERDFLSETLCERHGDLLRCLSLILVVGVASMPEESIAFRNLSKLKP